MANKPNLLSGKKTYLSMIALLLYAIGGALSGKLDWNAAIVIILGALGLSGLRSGIAKK